MRPYYLLLLAASLVFAPLSHAHKSGETIGDTEITIPLSPPIDESQLMTGDAVNPHRSMWLGAGTTAGVILLVCGAVLAYYSGRAIYVGDKCDPIFKDKIHPPSNATVEFCHENGVFTYQDLSSKMLGGFFGVTFSFFIILFGGAAFFGSLGACCCH